MNILMASSEISPYARTGGLGDVAGALPLTLSALRARVSAVMPLYRCVRHKDFGLKPRGESRDLEMGAKKVSYRLYEAPHGPAKVYFVDQPAYYDRDELYGTPDRDYPDNAERFIFFSKAVVDIARQMSPRPQVIHCHDWQTGLVPVYLARQEALKEDFSGTAAVFTVHNIGYQGLFPESDLRLTGLDPSLYNPEGLEFYSRINLLKGGIVFAAAVTTVSHRYAQEIQDPGYGFGLDGVMRKYRDKLFGILNGADYGSWNPETDRHLPANYSARAPEGKALCKKALQAELNLTVDSHIPLVGMVTRLVEQKGIELLLAGLSELLELNIQFVLLGTGAERYQEELQSLARRQPERSAVVLGFDAGLSHRIEAGCDFFLMPSRYEPCGLNQIYSLKYGTVPIVRATGGLDDTVVDFRQDPELGNGFKFTEYSPAALVQTVREALGAYRKAGWGKLVANAFSADFGWNKSARRYLEVFDWALERKIAKNPA